MISIDWLFSKVENVICLQYGGKWNFVWIQEGQLNFISQCYMNYGYDFEEI